MYQGNKEVFTCFLAALRAIGRFHKLKLQSCISMYRQQSNFSIQQAFSWNCRKAVPFLAVVWYSNTNEIKGDPSACAAGWKEAWISLKNSTVVVTVILCVLILAFLIFVLWQSHSSSPTIPTDPELLEQEWRRSTAQAVPLPAVDQAAARDGCNGNAIAGSSSGSGGSSGNTGSGSGGSLGMGVPRRIKSRLRKRI